MGIGTVELLIIVVIGLVYLAVPLATLAIMFLVYNKLNRIEETLNRKD